MQGLLTSMGVWFEIVVVLGAIAAAAVYVVGAVRRERDVELTRLAETRGQANADLRREVEALRLEVAELRGSLEAMKSLKAAEIAKETADLLRPFLIVTDA